MKKFSSILESLEDSPEKKALFDKIHPLKGWLYKSNGLDLNNIILAIMNEKGWKVKSTHQEIAKFQQGVEILKMVLGESWVNQKLREKLPRGIENEGLVRNNEGEWDYVNKLNTNYSDLSDMLSELIVRGMANNPEKGKIIYDAIMADPMKGLLMIKPSLKRLLEKYFPTIDDFKQFTRHTRVTSEIGERAENAIVEILIQNEFEIKYQGGNGDFIDMIFGCDIIVWRKDFGYKTIQVKNNIYWNNVGYYKVDWIGEGSSKKIFDKETRSELNLTPNLFDNTQKN